MVVVNFNVLGYWQESQREGDHWEDQDIGGWIILRCILERWDGVMWTGLVWLTIGTGGELLSNDRFFVHPCTSFISCSVIQLYLLPTF
jgi:hypothetical protein